MAVAAPPQVHPALRNLPNQLTIARLALSIVLFGLLGYRYYMAGFVVFLVAVTTDWLDGHIARKYGLVTTLGRILDPFVDKVIICGTYVYLAAVAESGHEVAVQLSQWMRAWMVVVVVGRELLITALRSFLEQEGADFSAAFSGKLKMVFQCIAASACMVYLTYDRVSAVPEWINWFVPISIWVAVASTVWSGASYVQRAVALIRKT